MLARLLAGGIHPITLAIPIIMIIGSIDICRFVSIIIEGKDHVETLRQQVPLVIFQGRHERMPLAMLVPIDRLLADTRLDVLIHVRIGEAQHQAIGPRLIDKPHLAHDGLVMIRIVETLYTLLVLRIYPSRDRAVGLEFKMFDIGIYPIIVIRIVLEGIHFIRQSVLERLPEVYIRLMRIERTIGIGSIRKPSLALLLRNDIDHTTDSIRPKAYGHHALIDLDALGKVHGDVIQSEGTAHAFLRNPVDEHFDMLPAEAIHHQLHVRTHAA